MCLCDFHQAARCIDKFKSKDNNAETGFRELQYETHSISDSISTNEARKSFLNVNWKMEMLNVFVTNCLKRQCFKEDFVQQMMWWMFRSNTDPYRKIFVLLK